MQSLRSSILSHARIRVSMTGQSCSPGVNALNWLNMHLNALRTFSGSSHDQILDRVITLAKNSYKIDAAKVTQSADFQKDLSLDSLDRVELVMAFEQEFSVEIPDEEADKMKCCADVAKYIASKADHQNAVNS